MNKLPQIKNKNGAANTGEDALMKLIRKNQQYSSATKGDQKTRGGDLAENAAASYSLPQHDYDEIRNLSYNTAKKEDKNELLSQYFSAKKSMSRVWSKYTSYADKDNIRK